jgi:hypothetical protein
MWFPTCHEGVLFYWSQVVDEWWFPIGYLMCREESRDFYWSQA